MAKGSIITNEMKTLIGEVYLEHPDFRAKEVQAEVERRSPEGQSPGLSAIQKELTKIRRTRLGTGDIHEKWWSLGSLSEKNATYMPPDSIPSVLEVQNDRIKRKESPLTMREAKWVARLHCLTSNIGELSLWARYYAAQEQASEATGVPFDTTLLDLGIINKAVHFAFFRWMATTDVVSDSEKQIIGEEMAHYFEVELLGHRLESRELTGKAWWWYILELGNILTILNRVELPKGKKESLVLRVQEYASKHHENFRRPVEIYEEAGISLNRKNMSERGMEK